MKADLHCHSQYSKHPSDWFLQRIGSAESYTTPDQIYHRMKERGMDFFAITDHNTMEGSLQLHEAYPETVIRGVESTAYFPEDQCKVHILIYDIGIEEFLRIESLRTNIYLLQDYLVESEIPHAVAHATFSVNGTLTKDHVERLLLLFSLFETRNGSRTEDANHGLSYLLNNLTPLHMDQLSQKHGLSPVNETPWIKGEIGGSDDHSGLYLGETYTEIPHVKNVQEFIQMLRQGSCLAQGRHSDFRSLTFHFYKVAVDFSSHRSPAASQGFLSSIGEYLSTGKPFGLRDKLNLSKIKNSAVKEHLRPFFAKGNKNSTMTERRDLLYTTLTNITDDLIQDIFTSLIEKVYAGDVIGLMRSISSLIPPTFLCAPFFSSLKYHYKDKKILTDLLQSLHIAQREHTRILWFTDTLFELNGPAESVKQIVQAAQKIDEVELILVTTATENETCEDVPPNTILLPACFSMEMPHYKDILLRIPSLLKTIEKIDALNAHALVLSTPGPLGLIAHMIGRVSSLPIHGIYHTDFAEQAYAIT
ncbi:glycosyl transferase group 1 [Chitinivibrio alkaliphilus]|uniref:Glycosyl transferase, group 1 n=1 Tax=Chitinivibrio alkaliphilus ACht1 TaxID=1313304 RepID=U7D4M6_9BACT|nr:glycosyl transferase group 1 [Chitinivibrio alkaliphilus]ERP30888.1 glycosyl transferase, group 1 [Chitinivibrio alkaliphilus ACht1]